MRLIKSNLIFQLIIIITISFGLLLLVSCQLPLAKLISTPLPDPASGGTNLFPPPPTKAVNTAADTITSLPQPSIITLTFWTIERFSPQDEIIAQQLAGFERNNPDIKIEVLLKRTSGQASALNLLKTAQRVAPSILPDVAILSTDDLLQAWRNKLIYPFDGLLDRTVAQDLLPAAQRLGTIDENLVGIPLELDVEHMVYNTGKVFTTPVVWTDVLSNVFSYHFPADGQNGLLNDSLLIQYLSTGAELTDEQGTPVIDKPALRTLLNYYKDLREEEIIDSKIIDAGRLKEVWNGYLAGLVEVTHVYANQYLGDRHLLSNTKSASIPSYNGETVTIGHGWAFVLTTDDSIRQKTALKLIEGFMQTEANARWATHATTIPTRQTAFDLVADEDPYWVFLRNYLDTTNPPPAFAGYDQLSRILLIAIQQVINGEATPDEAVETAIQALDQSTP